MHITLRADDALGKQLFDITLGADDALGKQLYAYNTRSRR